MNVNKRLVVDATYSVEDDFIETRVMVFVEGYKVFDEECQWSSYENVGEHVTAGMYEADAEMRRRMIAVLFGSRENLGDGEMPLPF